MRSCTPSYRRAHIRCARGAFLYHDYFTCESDYRLTVERRDVMIHIILTFVFFYSYFGFWFLYFELQDRLGLGTNQNQPVINFH
jgi:hypothetical protein